MLETFIYLHYCSISTSFSKHEFMKLDVCPHQTLCQGTFSASRTLTSSLFKTYEHDFQPASLNKILETRIFSASTSPVLSLCVMMNVCIKHKTKPPKILKFYHTKDCNWHHLQISIFNYNTDIKLRSNHHL